jgi:hypothetical protein
VIDRAAWVERMTYHPPTPEARQKHDALIDGFVDLGVLVLELVPEGREKALVLTKLEEAKFWASAGVARNQ